MDKFKGVLICTDLDGTLLKKDKTISAENVAAIEYFKREGGLFTFVTGRMPFFVDDIYNAVRPNAYFGCVNGGGLYDYARREYVWHSTMPEEVTELIRCIDEKFPNVGIQLNTFHHTYFCKENPTMANFRRVTGAPNLICDYNEPGEPIAKIIFGCVCEEDLQGVKETLFAHPLAEKFDFIRSEKALFEILPKGVGKGTAITKLMECLQIDPEKTIAIGDYNNDISMFTAAKVGIAVANACQDALDAADYITVSNEENAIAHIIRDLEEGHLPVVL